MSIPVNLLRFAGLWDATTRYSQYDFVESPIDGKCYIYVGVNDIVGGADPSVPNPVWVLFNAPTITPAAPIYGSFSSTITQTCVPATPLPIVYDTTDIATVGVSIVAPSSSIQVVNAGVYKVLSSIQMNKTGGGNAEVDMYPIVNGVPVPNSASKLQINNTEESVMTVEWFLALNAGSTVQIALFSPVANDIQALSVVAAPPVPAIPSIITTILRIS